MSVLGDLFADIAAAIRGKTGETGTMKPAEFPEKIGEIVTGAPPSIKFASGAIEPTASVETVEHGLGVMPDIVFVCLRSGVVQKTLTLVYAYGVSDAFKALITSSEVAGGAVASKAATVSDVRNTIDSGRSACATYGMIRDATTTTFTVGGEQYNLLDITPEDTNPDDDVEPGTVYYDWYAVGGIA